MSEIRDDLPPVIRPLEGQYSGQHSALCSFRKVLVRSWAANDEQFPVMEHMVRECKVMAAHWYFVVRIKGYTSYRSESILLIHLFPFKSNNTEQCTGKDACSVMIVRTLQRNQITFIYV